MVNSNLSEEFRFKRFIYVYTYRLHTGLGRWCRNNGDMTTTTVEVLSTTFQNSRACDIYCFGGFRIILRVPQRQTRLLLIKSKGRLDRFFFRPKTSMHVINVNAR